MVPPPPAAPHGVTVFRDRDGDMALGFECFAWHMHADMLVGTYGASEDVAVEQFVGALLNNKLLIAVVRDGGAAEDVFISRVPQKDLRYKPADESIEFRYWDGSIWPA
jgi:hypothetical protein